MANGWLQLCEYPPDMVSPVCEKCGRSGQYRKQNLIKRYGADARLPDVRELTWVLLAFRLPFSRTIHASSTRFVCSAVQPLFSNV
jgi:hypothetical protein